MNQSGYITLLTTLFIVVISGAIAIGVLWTAVGNTKTGLTITQSYQAKALVDACAEEALQKVREQANFSGSATISLGNGSCKYTVTRHGNNRTVTASGTVGTIVRKLYITATRTANTSIDSWQEVSD